MGCLCSILYFSFIPFLIIIADMGMEYSVWILGLKDMDGIGTEWVLENGQKGVGYYFVVHYSPFCYFACC